MTDLADAAIGALDGEVEQMQLEGTDHVRVKFVGMAWDTLESPSLKEEVEFIVRGIVVGHGEEVQADGEVRRTAKVKVTGVVANEPDMI